METTNTQSRRRSISGYQTILTDRENREALRKQSEEEESRKSQELQSENAQKVITEQCKEIQNHYTGMVNAGKEMRNLQDQLEAKMKEEELFQKTADEVYALTDIDESNVHKMKLRKYAYHGLPILDCFFAFFALYPIITSKFADASDLGKAMVVPIGLALSVPIGYGLSILSRFGVSSLDDGDKSSGMTILKKIAIGSSMLALPLMYIIGEFSFSGGTSWPYSAVFAFISLVIQLLIVSGYKNQIEALNYYRIKEQNEQIKTTKAKDERALQSEIQTLKDKTQHILEAFHVDYSMFRNKFTELAATRREYIKQFAKEPEIYLNQLTIFLGDLVCFRRMEIPFYREANGAISAIPVIEFPNVIGGQEIEKNIELLYIDCMLKTSDSSISLSETIRTIEEGYQKKLSTTSEDTRGNEINTDAGNEPVEDENEDGIW